MKGPRWDSGSVRYGFTLLELLVLLAIAAVLAAVLFPVTGEVRDRARGAVCASNLGQLVQGMYRYAYDHEGMFPPPQDQSLHSGPFPSVPFSMNTWHLYLIPYIGYEWSTDEMVDLFAQGVTWRSNSEEAMLLNCPSTLEELAPLPDFDSAYLNPWYHYGLNADLPNRALGVDRRSGVNVTIDELLYPAETMAILETWDWSAIWHREIADGSGFAQIPHGMAANVAFYDGSVRRIGYEELIAIESDSRFWTGGY